MKRLESCPICEEPIYQYISWIKITGGETLSKPCCRAHGVFGFWRRIWWASGIPGFFWSR